MLKTCEKCKIKFEGEYWKTLCKNCFKKTDKYQEYKYTQEKKKEIFFKRKGLIGD